MKYYTTEQVGLRLNGSLIVIDYIIEEGFSRLPLLQEAKLQFIGQIFYAVNWCVSQWNGRDTMDVINFFISRPGGLTRQKV